MRFTELTLSAQSVLSPLTKVISNLVSNLSEFGLSQWIKASAVNFTSKTLNALLLALAICVIVLSHVHAQSIDTQDIDADSEAANNEILPEISIAAGEFVFEGEDAVFTITSSITASEDLTISLDVGAESSRFLSGSPSEFNQVVIPAGQTTVSHIVETEDDDVEEVHGTISLTLQTGSGYSISEANRSAEIVVFDNDLSTPTLRVEAPKLSIQEGEIAEFKVVLEGSQNGDFYLIYSVVASHDGLINGLIGGHSYTYSELFSSSSGSLDPLIYAAKAIQGRIEKSYFYQSIDDGVYQQNSEITFTILQQNESTYNVSTATATIEIVDNDAPIESENIVETPVEIELPEISITSISTESIEEGKPAQFRLVTSNPLIDPLNIYVEISETGNMLASGPTVTTIEFPAGEITQDFVVETFDDENDEADSEITVSLLADANQNATYELDSNSNTQNASVSISDNDEAVVILPELTLSASSSSIDEGYGVTITLESDQPAPATGLVVNYTKQQVGDFFASEFDGQATATIAAGETSEDINIWTRDDVVDEEDGNFTIALEHGTGYTLGDVTSQTVNVADNDKPIAVISTSSGITRVDEGDSIEFKVELDLASWQPIAVNVKVSQDESGGDFIDSNYPLPTEVNFPAGSRAETFTIHTVYDKTNQPDGDITAQLLAGDHYGIFELASSASKIKSNITQVTVVNDDVDPVVSLSADSSSVVEGGEVTITFALDQPAPTAGLEIDYVVQHEGNFFATSFGGHASATISAGESAKDLEVETQGDEIDEDDGSFHYHSCQWYWIYHRF